MLVLNIFIATNDADAGDNCALSNPLIYQPTFGIIWDFPNNTCLHRGVHDGYPLRKERHET